MIMSTQIKRTLYNRFCCLTDSIDYFFFLMWFLCLLISVLEIVCNHRTIKIEQTARQYMGCRQHTARYSQLFTCNKRHVKLFDPKLLSYNYIIYRKDARIGGVLAGLLQTTKCDEFGRVLLRVLMTNKNAVLFTTNEMLCALLSEPTEVSK